MFSAIVILVAPRLRKTTDFGKALNDEIFGIPSEPFFRICVREFPLPPAIDHRIFGQRVMSSEQCRRYRCAQSQEEGELE